VTEMGREKDLRNRFACISYFTYRVLNVCWGPIITSSRLALVLARNPTITNIDLFKNQSFYFENQFSYIKKTTVICGFFPDLKNDHVDLFSPHNLLTCNMISVETKVCVISDIFYATSFIIISSNLLNV
jgi:hypothetical protein